MVIEQCCGNKKYNAATEFCQSSDIVKPLCGNQTYTSWQFCSSYDRKVYYKCGNEEYNPENQRCLSDVIYYQCGTNWYNPATEFCQNGTDKIKSLCGTQTYTATEYCSNGIKKTYGYVIYEGQIYKTVVIGAQTWMAENLNYDAEGSKCLDDNLANCDKYGRFYSWPTAMEVCPDNWHLPTNEEWDELSNFVGECFHLKAQEGWTNCGPSSSGNYYSYSCEDTYGFAALPGGGFFYEAGRYGYWWSASITNYEANVRSISNLSENMGRSVTGATSNISRGSVRCIRD
jgi:uncharacterized protein (TIGR02145 family)